MAPGGHQHSLAWHFFQGKLQRAQLTMKDGYAQAKAEKAVFLGREWGRGCIFC